jgi:hypothetical protein
MSRTITGTNTVGIKQFKTVNNPVTLDAAAPVGTIASPMAAPLAVITGSVTNSVTLGSAAYAAALTVTNIGSVVPA